MIHKIITGLLAASLLTSGLVSVSQAETIPTYKIHDPKAWVGEKTEDLIMFWGTPDRTVKLSSGGELLSYDRGRRIGYEGKDSYESLSKDSLSRNYFILNDDVQFRSSAAGFIIEYVYLTPVSPPSRWIWFSVGFLAGAVAVMTALVVAYAASGVGATD